MMCKGMDPILPLPFLSACTHQNLYTTSNNSSTITSRSYAQRSKVLNELTMMIETGGFLTLHYIKFALLRSPISTFIPITGHYYITKKLFQTQPCTRTNKNKITLPNYDNLYLTSTLTSLYSHTGQHRIKYYKPLLPKNTPQTKPHT
jgi:hypothetical protein